MYALAHTSLLAVPVMVNFCRTVKTKTAELYYDANF